MKTALLLILSTLIFSADISVDQLFTMTDTMSLVWTADAKKADSLNDNKMKEDAKEKFARNLYNNAFSYLPYYMKYIKNPSQSELKLNKEIEDYNLKFMILEALLYNGSWNAKTYQVDRHFDYCMTQLKVVDTLLKSMNKPAITLKSRPTLVLK